MKAIKTWFKIFNYNCVLVVISYILLLVLENNYTHFINELFVLFAYISFMGTTLSLIENYIKNENS